MFQGDGLPVEVKTKMNIGEVIKKCRTKRGMTQFDLALRSGVPPATISSVETSVRNSSVNTIVKLLKAMDYDLAVVDRREKRLFGNDK